jgi:hypothetical protein
MMRALCKTHVLHLPEDIIAHIDSRITALSGEPAHG